MTDRRGTVFVDPAPDSAAPPRPVPGPVSASDIIGAHWTLARQDFAGAKLQTQIDAYGPIVTELMKRDPPVPWYKEDPYTTAARSGMPYNPDHIWSAVERYRQQDPTFLKDIPARNDAEFNVWVAAQEAKRSAGASDVASRERGLGQKTLGFVAGAGSGLADPINLGAMLATGGLSTPIEAGAGAVRTLTQTAARELLVNAGTEVAELPIIAGNRADRGETMTPGDMLEDVAQAGLGGAIFGAGGHLLAKGAGAVLNNDAARAAALAVQPLPKVTPDDVVAAAFREHVPAEYRTPDQQAALHVIDRQSEISATNPYHPTPAGMDAHADNLDAAMRTVAGAIDPDAPIPPAIPRRGTLPSVSRGTAAPGAAPDLSPDRIVRFVQNDLEGGATVVHFSQADGGTTKYGIAQAANPGVDVASLTADQAAAIAHRKYWLPEFDHVDPRIAAVGFDAGYIGGPETARRILRESGGDPMKAIELYREHLNHIADTVPGKEKFRKGWNNRVDKLAKLVAGDDRPVLRPEGFADDTELAASQSAIDHAEMDAQLAAHEAALATGSRQGELDFSANEPHAGAMEGSALPDRAGVADAPVVPRETTPVSQPAPELQPTVAQSTASDGPLGPAAFVDMQPREGKPGVSVINEEGHFASAVYRDSAGHAQAVVRMPISAEGRAIINEVSSYVRPEFRRKGIATKLYDALREAGHNVDGLSGEGDLTPDGAAFVNARRRVPRETLRDVPRTNDPYRQIREQRLGWVDGRPPASQLSAAGDHAIGTADVTLAKEAAKGFDDPHGAAAKEQVDGLAHDIKQRLEAGELGAEHFATSGVELAGGDTAPIYQNAHAILAALDEEDAALAALRGCM